MEADVNFHIPKVGSILFHFYEKQFIDDIWSWDSFNIVWKTLLGLSNESGMDFYSSTNSNNQTIFDVVNSVDEKSVEHAASAKRMLLESAVSRYEKCRVAVLSLILLRRRINSNQSSSSLFSCSKHEHSHSECHQLNNNNNNNNHNNNNLYEKKTSSSTSLHQLHQLHNNNKSSSSSSNTLPMTHTSPVVGLKLSQPNFDINKEWNLEIQVFRIIFGYLSDSLKPWRNWLRDHEEC